ncbi:Ionotropic receptor 25a [Strongyloides ratti]|uniref:Ionotropic receptor 25a n=1 Tax=Strongyloides ratti TaxID=34506 RepID=A0A090KUS5_STRRB|nr:Ionotropic receptor 25a [Strongyloides ratti]CEF59620.1 Ionotropic receptor 25a [Strongyloides ratti]
MYMKNKIPNENITFEVIKIKNNFSYEYLCKILPPNTVFIINGKVTKNNQEIIYKFVNETQIPMIQLQYDLEYLNINKTCLENDYFCLTTTNTEKYYIQLIPAVNIFYLSLGTFLPLIPFQNDIGIIYDFTVNQLEINLTSLIKNIPIINGSLIESKATNKEIKQQLLILSQMYKTLIFMCQTSTIENYVLISEEYFDKNTFTWIAFTTDVTPFKCFNCLTVDIFWIRIHHKTRPNNIYTIREYIITQNFNENFSEILKPYNYVKVSTFFEIFETVYNFVNTTFFEKIDSNLTLCYKTKYWKKHSVKSAMFDIENYNLPDYGEYLSSNYTSSLFYQNVGVRIYKIVRRRDLYEGNINKYLGNWTYNDGVTIFYGNFSVDVYLLKNYRIAAIIQPPFIQLKQDNNKNLEGYCIDLLNLIQDDLKFNYTLYLVEDGLFGTVDENGIWNGVVGDIVAGNADFSIASLAVMAEREIDIDYTIPYYDLVGTTILVKKAVVDNSLFKFFQVLEIPVWCAILGAYLLTSILLWLYDRLSPFSYTNLSKKTENSELENKRKFTLKECLWFCLTSLTPQGGGETPLNASGRFLSATWWVFSFIIIATYTANLAAFLTVSRLEQSISSLDDLANQYKVDYAPIKGSDAEMYFKRMAMIEEKFYNIWKEISLNESLNSVDRAKLAIWDYPVSEKFSNLWRNMQQSKLPNNIDEAINRVLTSENGFAFIGDAMDIQYAVLTNCDLQIIGNEFSRKPYALGIQSAHPMKDKLSTSILRLLHQRKLEELKSKWWDENPNKAKCPTTSDNNYGIKIENIGGVFIVILGGIVIAIITLIIEYIYHHQMIKKKVKLSMSNNTTDSTIHMSNIFSTSIDNDAFEDIEINELQDITSLRHRNTINTDN